MAVTTTAALAAFLAATPAEPASVATASDDRAEGPLIVPAREHGARSIQRAGDGRGGFRVRRLGSFSNPVYVHGPSGGKGLVFVVQQHGVVRMIKRGRKLRGSFLDIRSRVRSGGEQGLLSIAFAPGYAKNRRFYVAFTDNSGDLRVQEYKRSRKSRRRALRRSARDVIKIEQPFANHNGGQLQFGPDRRLYIATGDGGSAGDPDENAQSKRSLLGKILRIDPRRKGGRRYRVPGDNPFVGRKGRNEIYSLGLRNPWRFSFDRNRRRVVIADVGQNAREEVDYETLAGASGANFGWDAFEGTLPYGPDGSSPPKDHERPIHELRHSDGNCSITGGYVVRDRRIPSLFGRYLYADFCRGQIRSLVPRLGGARRDRSARIGAYPGIATFGEDARRRVYLASLSSDEVYRIVPK